MGDLLQLVCWWLVPKYFCFLTVVRVCTQALIPNLCDLGLGTLTSWLVMRLVLQVAQAEVFWIYQIKSLKI